MISKGICEGQRKMERRQQKQMPVNTSGMENGSIVITGSAEWEKTTKKKTPRNPRACREVGCP
jgi:hypothetical protein